VARTESKDGMAEQTSPVDGTSRLLELLRRVGREESGTVGFGRPRQGTTRRAPLLLAAALPAATEEGLTAAREAGADAALISLAEAAVPAAVAAAGGSAWPVAAIAALAQHITPADLERWRAGGIDAVAVEPRAALAACFSPSHPGLLALLDQHLPLDGLRATAVLSVDGYVLVDGGTEGRLTGDDLLWLTLAGGLVRGPALFLSSRVVAEDLEALVAAGVLGIAIRFPEGSGGAAVRERVSELRAAVDHLDPHLRQGRRDRAGYGPVVIPTTSEAV
jgi:hypothetical protein